MALLFTVFGRRFQTFSTKRNIFFTAFWQLSFKFWDMYMHLKPAPLQIKDHKFLLLLSSAFYFIFPPKSTACQHLEWDISHIGLHGGLDLRMVIWWYHNQKFLAWMGYHIFLPVVLRAGAELCYNASPFPSWCSVPPLEGLSTIFSQRHMHSAMDFPVPSTFILLKTFLFTLLVFGVVTCVIQVEVLRLHLQQQAFCVRVKQLTPWPVQLFSHIVASHRNTTACLPLYCERFSHRFGFPDCASIWSRSSAAACLLHKRRGCWRWGRWWRWLAYWGCSPEGAGWSVSHGPCLPLRFQHTYPFQWKGTCQRLSIAWALCRSSAGCPSSDEALCNTAPGPGCTA